MTIVAETANDLHIVLKRLARSWADSEQNWNDSVRRDFEKRYWQPLADECQTTAKEMDHLAQVLAQARRSVQ
ncbi:MAG: hypothetical protein IPL60_12170 [Ardenticatenia bacterium]|nr:hypothetical protein [Ardenticatenia bacterium]